MKSVIFSIVFSFFLIISMLPFVEGGTWEAYNGNAQRSNYVEGIGNISYPVIKHSSREKYFTGIPGPVMLVGNINHDSFLEIVAVSEKTNTLYVFDHNLSLLWSYKVTNPSLPEEKYTEWDKVSSLALGDINGDGIDEILFSMCEDNSTSTILRAFSGNGTEIWDRTIPGRITKQSLLIGDVNNDGENEIIVGASNIYILDGEGNIISSKELSFDEYTGVSEIALKGNKVLASIWHYSSQDVTKYSANGKQSYSTDRPLYSLLNLILFNISENLTLKTIWSKEMENSASPFSDMCLSFYASPSFDVAYALYRNGIIKIDVDNGSMKEIATWNIAMGVSCSIKNDSSYWAYAASIFSLSTENNCPIWLKNYTQSRYNLFHKLLVFDVNNDGKEEVITIKGRYSVVFFDAKNGSEILEANIFSKESELVPEILLHADTDNDGFDEIITTDPEGRIVIIDNGTPPKENKGISMEMLVLTGIGTIITASALIWIWRKKRNGK